MTIREPHYYNAIAIATHCGYATMKHYHRISGGNWKAAYWMLKNDPALLPKEAAPLPDPGDAYVCMTSFGIRLVLDTENEFPSALRHIPHPPLAIYLRSDPAATLPASPSTIAVVGTRRAGEDGKKIARSFARELATAGLTIASGLAFGIDAAAHEGALDASGTTVAVLAGGLDAIYPHSHRALAERILAQGGTLISEYPPGEPPLPYRFIERNRIMSGLSRGVLIIEAPESSGALATARYAVEQNRDVFVVPGAITTNRFAGSHALIRQGAQLVVSAEDILEEYSIRKKKSVATETTASTPQETLILKALADISAPTDVDKLIELTRLEPRVVNQTLSFLLIQGIIKESEGGYTI